MDLKSVLATASLLFLPSLGCSDSGEVRCGPGTHRDIDVCVSDEVLSDAGGTSPDAGAGSQVDASTVPADAKRVFVTRTTYSGGLGGLAGADAKCMAAAAAGSLDGTYMAWLSSESVDAIDRIAGNGPWYDLADDLIFANHAALMTAPLVEIVVQEDGSSIVTGEDQFVWTGTQVGGLRDGSAADDFCVGWMSGSGNSSNSATIGYASLTDRQWTERGMSACFNEARLYCLEL